MRSYWDRCVETAFVLLVVVAPLTFRSMAAYAIQSGGTASFDFQAAYRTLESVCTIAIVLFVVWRYQGAGGVVGVAAIGLVYGAIFCKIRRVWPLILAHGLQDFVSIAILAARR